MATLPVGTLPGERELGKRARTRHISIRLALPLLVALAALLGMPGIALAGGTPPSVSVAVDPATGPVGTQVNVKGSNFAPGSSIAVGYATGNCSSGVTIISGAKGTAAGDGTISIVFVWPPTGKGNYTICVIDQTNGHTYPSANHFTVTSTTPPSITVSSPVNSGKPVTVTGAGFLTPGGGTIEILYGPGGSSGCATSAGTATLNADGSFTFTFNAPFESKDTQITITAAYPQGACDGSWILRASKTVTVLAAAAATPSPTAKPTSAPAVTPTTSTTTPVGIVFPPSFPPTAAETVVYCLVGLLVLLLLLLLFLLLSRRRKQDKPVTIKQQDKPVVNSGGGQGGSPMVQSSIYAENPRNQRRTQIAEEVTTIQEEPINPPTPPNTNPFNQSPRFGPAGGNGGGGQ